MSENNRNAKPDGLSSMRTTTAFRVINFELYAKPAYHFIKQLRQAYMDDCTLDPPVNNLYKNTCTPILEIIHYYRSAKQKINIVIMSIGVTCFGLALGYIAYMRQKYESMGYYAAVDTEGKEIFEKKKSKWD